VGGKRRHRIDATGRNPDATGSEDRTIILRRSLWHSPHIAAASGASRALVVELQSMFNGKNNGELFLSVRDAADRLGFTDLEAAQNAINELEALALVSVTIDGTFAMKAGETSKARAFRLNWIGTDGKCVAPEKLPPLDFSALTPRQKKRIASRGGALDRYLKEQQKRKIAVRETRTLMADSVRETRTEAASTVRETRTLNGENGQNPPSHSVRDSLTHILHHIPVASGERPDPPILPSEIAGGPVADEAAVALRNRIARYFFKLSPKRQRSWAEAHGTTREDVKLYCISDFDRLPAAKVAAMVCSIKREKAAQRTAKAQNSGARHRAAAGA
jgi:hypothetical protein